MNRERLEENLLHWLMSWQRYDIDIGLHVEEEPKPHFQIRQAEQRRDMLMDYIEQYVEEKEPQRVGPVQIDPMGPYRVDETIHEKTGASCLVLHHDESHGQACIRCKCGAFVRPHKWKEHVRGGNHD